MYLLPHTESQAMLRPFIATITALAFTLGAGIGHSLPVSKEHIEATTATVGRAPDPALTADPAPDPEPTALPTQHPGPSVVDVPLESSLEVRPANGWQFTSCDTLLAATPLVTACSPQGFTVHGPAYDAAIKPVRVTMQLQHGSTQLTIDYIIRLSTPPPAEAPDTTLPLPLPAGAVSLIPLSLLDINCGLCSPHQASIEVVGIDPSDAGEARVTAGHLVLTPAANTRGLLSVDLRVHDDLATASRVFRVNARVIAPGATPIIGFHLQRPVASLELSVNDLALQLGETAPLTILRCDPAVHGSVHCTQNGKIRYEPAAAAADSEAPEDQFAVVLLAADGRAALASVTLSGTAPRVAPAIGGHTAPLAFRPSSPPPGESDAEISGVTTAFTAMMDAIAQRENSINER